MPRAMADHIQICRKRHARRGAPKADLDRRHWNVRFKNSTVYSMTSSANARSLSGTVNPSALAVFMLITNSNLTGVWTGSSLGFSPLRIRSA